MSKGELRKGSKCEKAVVYGRKREEKPMKLLPWAQEVAGGAR